MTTSSDAARSADIGDRERGTRAEDVAAWYFRLNGFLAIPGFVVHIDSPIVTDGRRARTEADLIAVRFPRSREVIADREMEDDQQLIGAAAQEGIPLFVLVEVKAGECRMNGPWTDCRAKNMQRVIRRLGFAESEDEVNSAATALYDHAYWKGEHAIVRYACVGERKNVALAEKYNGLLQVNWSDIGVFLFRRFQAFPEKLPSGQVHAQWPTFGAKFGNWFVKNTHRLTAEAAAEAVSTYVKSGTMPVI